MTTTWKIYDTKSLIENGLILNITYGCLIELDGIRDQTIGDLEVVGDAKLKGFIPYDKLTEEVLIKWVKDSLGSEGVLEIETNLQDSIKARQAAKAAETVKTGLPFRFNS